MSQPVKMTAHWLENLGNAGRLPIQIIIKNMNAAQDEVERLQRADLPFSAPEMREAMNAAVQYATVAAPYCHAKIAPVAEQRENQAETIIDALRQVLAVAQVIQPATMIVQDSTNSQNKSVEFVNPYV